MVVFGVEGGDALFADGAVCAVEGWDLWTGHPLCRWGSGVGGEGGAASCCQCCDEDGRGEGLYHHGLTSLYYTTRLLHVHVIKCMQMHFFEEVEGFGGRKKKIPGSALTTCVGTITCRMG